MSGKQPDTQSLNERVDAYVLVPARATHGRTVAAGDAGPMDLDLTSTPDNLFRWAWRLGGHSRKPTGKERRKLRRKVRKLVAGKGSRRARLLRNQPGRGPGSYGFVIDFLALVFDAAGCPWMISDLQRMPLRQRPGYLARMRGSRSGNERSLEVRRHGKDGKGGKTHRDAEALRLHVAGLSNREIAERLQVHEKTVQRALAGNRARRRTGRRKRVADICGRSKHARDPALRSVQVETRR